MSDAVQIATMFFGFLTTVVTLVIGYFQLKLNKKQAETNTKLEANTVATEKQGEQLTGVAEKVVKIEKQTDGMATMIGAAKLAQGLAQGGLEERNRADDKATAKAELAPPKLEGEVTAIIDQYKAGELKKDVAEMKQDVAKIPDIPKRVVDEQERRETK